MIEVPRMAPFHLAVVILCAGLCDGFAPINHGKFLRIGQGLIRQYNIELWTLFSGHGHGTKGEIITAHHLCFHYQAYDYHAVGQIQ